MNYKPRTILTANYEPWTTVPSMLSYIMQVLWCETSNIVSRRNGHQLVLTSSSPCRSGLCENFQRCVIKGTWRVWDGWQQQDHQWRLTYQPASASSILSNQVTPALLYFVVVSLLSETKTSVFLVRTTQSPNFAENQCVVWKENFGLFQWFPLDDIRICGTLAGCCFSFHYNTFYKYKNFTCVFYNHIM